MDSDPTSALLERDKSADSIIQRHVVYTMLTGGIPIPWLDLVAASAVQLDLLKQLATYYSVDFDAQAARAFVTSAGTALAGLAAGRAGASFLKAIPGVGWIAGGVGQAVLAGASTYAVGNLVKRLFREGKGLDELTAQVMRDELAGYFAKGQQVARSLVGNTKSRPGGDGA